MRRIWRWWLALPIVALAFAGGFFGRKLLDDEPDEASPITIEAAESVPLGTSRPGLEDMLGGAPLYARERSTAPGADSCQYYAIADAPDSAWEFCFSENGLISSKSLGGGG